MKKLNFSIIAILLLCMVMGACKKKEVDVNKLKDIISQGVIDEQKEDGNDIVIDTLFLNPSEGGSYKGMLFGHVGDSLALVYQLSVTDDGSEGLDVEWDLLEPDVKPLQGEQTED